jgi:hypothetical protein
MDYNPHFYAFKDSRPIFRRNSLVHVANLWHWET